MAYRIGVDVGGSFTDWAVLDDGGALTTLKVFSRPDEPGQEIAARLEGLRDRHGIEAAMIARAAPDLPVVTSSGTWLVIRE